MAVFAAVLVEVMARFLIFMLRFAHFLIFFAHFF